MGALSPEVVLAMFEANVTPKDIDIEQEWVPPFAPHVRGKITRREDAHAGMPEPQWVYCYCSNCKGVHVQSCTSGSVRTIVQRFGFVHLHRDPMKDPAPPPGTFNPNKLPQPGLRYPGITGAWERATRRR